MADRFRACCNTLCQGVTGLVLFSFMLAALIANKVSLVALLGGTIINNVDLETWYAAWGLVFVVPELFALLKVLWNTSFIKRTRRHQWPSATAIFVGFMTSFAEVTSFMVFTVEVAPRLPVQVLLPLLNAVFAVSLCHEQWEHFQWRRPRSPQVNYRDGNFRLEKKSEEGGLGSGRSSRALHPPKHWQRVILTVFGFSGVWASCAISAIVSLTTELPWFQALCLPACLCLLSLCWYPKVQVYTVRSSDGTFQGRWKASCMYTLFKIIILCIGLSLVMALRMREHGVLDKNFFLKLYDGIYACRHKEIFYPLLIHFSSSFTIHTIGYVATVLCMPGTVIGVPSIIATPVSCAIVIFFCLWGGAWLDDGMCLYDSVGIWCACVLAVVTFFAPFVIRRRLLYPNAGIVLKPYDELFIQPTWNSIFIEQHMCLNYKHDGFSGHDHVIMPPDKKVNNRIYICTTMYREADIEMGRLLRSLNKVSQSTKMNNTYFEAHIFMDNGTSDLHLTDFASQLISLLEDKIGVTAKDANAFMTPYGVQLNWILPKGMPFFIHLKDSAKVKPKKRWSQVMYMSYVLNFRNLRETRLTLTTNEPPIPDSLIDDSLFVGYSSDKEWEKNNSALTTTSKQHVSASASSLELSDKERPEPRSKVHKWYPTPASPDTGASVVTNTTSMTSISSILNTFSAELIHHTSSDQGIGTVSDEFSSSSNSARQIDESSEATISASNSVRQVVGGVLRDEGWHDYDGDLSSNNENSLTSSKAKKFTNRIFNDDVIYESSVPAHKSDTKRKRHQTPHPPRHHRHPRTNPRAGVERQNSRTQLISRDDISFGADNPAYAAVSGDDAVLTMTMPAIPTSLSLHRATDASKQAAPAKLQGKKANGIFVISNDTVPHSHELESRGAPASDDHTYILATDADMEFTDDSVRDLLNLCNSDLRIGGACGRTHPIGQRSGPLVWYQMFEYAKDFWMIKSAQNVIGSVMCCPGCFSLYRAGAVRDIIAYYAGPTQHPFDVFVKDTGEDRWMCTLMMLHGWKLEYTSFCNNTTYCPDSYDEFMKQRRRWVLSDMSNMLLVFKNIFKLAQKNDSFSIAYILYMIQMFIIVLLSPASTIVILAGGLDIVFGIPFELIAPLMGVLLLIYALICIVGSMKAQVRLTLFLTFLMGLAMLLVVIGGSVYVLRDLSVDWHHGTLTFQEYYLILLLIAALVLAALLHPHETWIVGHGLSYLLGFPAMQILLPVYAVCNVVDQSWGTRDENKSKPPPVTCFSKNRKKYHKSLSRKSQLPAEESSEVSVEGEAAADEDDEKPIDCSSTFKPMHDQQGQETAEFYFWSRLRELVLGRDVNLGLEGEKLAGGLRSLRNIGLIALLLLNTLWLVLLSVLYFNADVNLARLNIYGLIALVVYGLVLFVQLLGMTVHRVQALFNRFTRAVFARDKPIWIYTR